VTSIAGAAVALAVVVLRGVVVRRRVLEAVYFDADVGRMRSLASSPRRVAEWLVVHHPQAVRRPPQAFCECDCARLASSHGTHCEMHSKHVDNGQVGTLPRF
jgi:hypothetical protein